MDIQRRISFFLQKVYEGTKKNQVEALYLVLKKVLSGYIFYILINPFLCPLSSYKIYPLGIS